MKSFKVGKFNPSPLKESSYAGYYKAILYKIKDDVSNNEPLIKKYVKLISDSRNEYYKNTGKSKDIGKPKWKDILKISNKVIKEGQSLDKLIVAFYTLQPPSRIENLFYLTPVKNLPKKVDKQLNYFVYGVARPYFLYNHHKNDTTGKVIKVPVISKLNKILLEYIKDNDIKDGDKFITNYSKTAGMSKKISNIFETYGNKHIVLNDIRHAYATFVNEQNMSFNDRQNIAKKMGHSVSINLLYSRHID